MSGVHGNSRRSALPARLSAGARAATVLLPLLLAACGGIQVRPENTLPRALVQPMSVRAGLVIDQELRQFAHEETRAGNDWRVELGAAHEKFFRSIFGSSFDSLQVYESLDAARAAGGLQVLFRPQIEQFSFATANETSGGYWAVTIRYRIAVLSPQGETVDTLSLTGYGSALGAGRAVNSLSVATRSAMRDAAAKFLVQMPRQGMAKKLLAGEVMNVADAAVLRADPVETVPIEPAG